VVFDALRCKIPRLRGVALRTVRPHLTTVNVRVAIGAIFSNVDEDGLQVTLHAVHFLVLAAQGVVCFVVIEFRHDSDGAPSRRGVAIFAGDGQGSMGISRGGPLGSGLGLWRRDTGPGPECGRRESEEDPKKDLKERERKGLRTRDRPGVVGKICWNKSYFPLSLEGGQLAVRTVVGRW
jgi:hypothetical protein